jgi:cytochrome b561
LKHIILYFIFSTLPVLDIANYLYHPQKTPTAFLGIIDYADPLDVSSEYNINGKIRHCYKIIVTIFFSYICISK